MKVLEILQNMPCGSVITDKRVLLTLKRAGIIFDYSSFGYLESQNVYYMDLWNGNKSIEHTFTYSGPAITDEMSGSHNKPYACFDSLCETGKYSTSIYNAEYKGFKFESRYLDGCFNAYLVLSGKPDTDKQEVKPRMSVFGNVI